MGLMFIQRLIRRVPSRAEVASWKVMRPIAPLIRHDHIWRFNRRAVRNGVALGLFMGTVVPLGQAFAAALVAAPLRANLAVAALCTFVTNPFTTPFFYIAAYAAGSFALGREVGIISTDGLDIGAMLSGNVDALGGGFGQAGQWLIAIAVPILLGLILIGGALALVGYAGTELGWRSWVRRRWRGRVHRRYALQPS